MLKDRESQMEGWSSRKIEDVPFLQCPSCGSYRESLILDENNMVTCVITDKKIPFDDFQQVSLPTSVVSCKHCGTKVPLTSMNRTMNGLGYMCPECLNYVAFKFNGHTYQPKTIMSLKWNKEICDRGVYIKDKLIFSECKTKKDFSVLRVLSSFAISETHFFLSPTPNVHKLGLLIDIEKQKYLGYVMWTQEKFTNKNNEQKGSRFILNQIFVVKDERRKGYATSLLKVWVENIVKDEKFVVEEPNNITIKILIRLDYAEENGEEIIGKKCSYW